jgi:hypothetical protein
MSTTRSVRPTDLVALVSLDGRVYPNEARTWDRLGRAPERPRILDSALVPWISFATGRQTWISVQGQAIRGLVSARRRGNRTAWEIDCLIAATDDDRIVANLFEQVSTEAAHAGVLRIFLRLERESELASPARRAGFAPYSEETLMRCEGQVEQVSLGEGVSAVAYRAADAFALYRLYNASVPEAIRRTEAPTFQQWQASAERRTKGRTGRNLVVRCNGELIANIRTSRENGLSKIDLLVHPNASTELPALTHLACSNAGAKRPLFCLVPAYAGAVATSLEQSGFRPESEYVVFVKRTAQPLQALKPVRTHATATRPVAAI